jgi:hypothetical protein
VHKVEGFPPVEPHRGRAKFVYLEGTSVSL